MMIKRAFIKLKENSSIVLILFLLLSILFRTMGFTIVSGILLWAFYTLLALIFISFFIQASSQQLEIPAKALIIFIPFLPVFGFMDAFLMKAIMSLCIIIIYLIASDRILWLNKNNWQYSFLIIFLYIISIVFSFVSIKYSGNTNLKVIDELASPNEIHRLVTKREVSGSAVGQTYVFLDSYYFNLIKKSDSKYNSSWTGLPILQWIDDNEYKINEKDFKIKK